MPTFYEGSVGTVETEITREEFTAAWRLDQERNGRLKNIGVKRAAAMVVFLAVIFWGIPAYPRYFATVWAPLILAAGCGAVLVYYGILLPRWVEQQGEACFDSQVLLGKPCEVQLYRDSYIIKNAWETITGHWTDNTACIENADLFVITGGWDRNLLVIPKRSLCSGQAEVFHAHFERAFAKRFFVRT